MTADNIERFTTNALIGWMWMAW